MSVRSSFLSLLVAVAACGAVRVSMGNERGEGLASPPPEEVRRAAPAGATVLSEPALSASLPHSSLPEPITGFICRQAGDGETLESLAERSGGTPSLVRSYNRLAGPLEAGRPLILPCRSGASCTLPTQPVVVERGSKSRPRVAVTLDAGSGAGPVPQMLRVLRERGLTITFFLTGDFIAANPDLVREMTADGHEFGNHSLTHPDFCKLTELQMRHELEATEHLLNLTSGATTRPFFRPPYGAYNDRVLQVSIEEGFLPVYWTLDSLDSVGASKSPKFLFDRMTARLSPEELRGAIFLMHCDSDPTATALPFILDRLKQLGMEVARLSRVLNAE